MLLVMVDETFFLGVPREAECLNWGHVRYSHFSCSSSVQFRNNAVTSERCLL